MIIDKNFRRPDQILVFERKNFFFYLVKSQNNNRILFYSGKKKNSLIKSIRSNFSKSLLIKLGDNETFGEIDKSGSQLILRKVNGKIIKKIKISKKILNIECLIYDYNQCSLLVLDSKLNQIIKINLAKIHDVKISFQKCNKSKISFENSKLCLIDNDKYIFSNNDELYLLDSKFNKIKKISKPGRDGPYTFRKVTSIKHFNKQIIICDSLNYKIKIYDLNFKFLKSFGGKGIGIKNLDLPVALDVFQNTLFLADMNNDRILSVHKNKVTEEIKTKCDNDLLRRPIKIVKYNNFLTVLDRDNSRIVFFKNNLKRYKNIILKRFRDGKPNSFDFLLHKNRLLMVVLYRFTNLKNKIFIFNLKGKIIDEIKIDTKDAQDLSIFDSKIAIADTNNRSLIIYDYNKKTFIKKNLVKFTKNSKLLNKTVCWDEFGNVFTTDFDKCVILKFDINLKFLEKINFEKMQNKLKVIRGIKVYQNYLFILNRGTHQLIVYDLIKRKIYMKFKDYKNLNFCNPTSTTISKNYIYISDKENDRVVKLKFR